jgi:branched-chain amino acid aminotransferase
VKSSTGNWAIGDGQAGPVTMRLREHLLGLQFGRVPDPHGWVHKIC